MRFAANGTLSGAMSTSAASKGLRSFNKTWTSGDTLRVFYPLVWVEETGTWDVIVGAVWGHEIRNTKELKFKNFARFVPSLCDVNPDGSTNGEPDLAYKFSMIAPVFTAAKKSKEMAAINARKGLTPEMKQEAIKEIEARFDPASMSSEKPVLAKRDFITTAVCVTVKYMNGRIDPASAAMVYQPIRGTKARTLIEILGDERYVPIHQDGEDYGVLEVQYNFPAIQERSQCSRESKIVGLTASERSEIIDPDSYNAIKSRITNLPRKPEDITRRTTRQVSENELKQAISSYSILMLDNLDALRPETNSTDIETLCRHQDVLRDLNLIQSLTNQDLIAALDAADKEAVQANPIQVDQAPSPVESAPQLDGLLTENAQNTTPPVIPSAAVETPTESPVGSANVDSLQSAATSATGLSDSEFEDLDLTI